MEGVKNLKILLALVSVYVLWGSTYLAIRIAIESIPPFLMAGLRFSVTGLVLYLILRLKGERPPSKAGWASGAVMGALLLLVGNGGVVYAEQWVASSIAALGVATVPLWTVLFGGIWKRWPRPIEWAGLALGFAGVALLNIDGDLRAYPIGALAIMVAAMSWAFGSALSPRLSLPAGLMAGAVQMLSGGFFLIALSILWGEPVPTAVSMRSVLALGYLMVFGALIGFSAYTYLMMNTRATVATSYAYVNPVFAVILGVFAAGEDITLAGAAAMFVIVTAVLLVFFGGRERLT